MAPLWIKCQSIQNDYKNAADGFGHPIGSVGQVEPRNLFALSRQFWLMQHTRDDVTSDSRLQLIISKKDIKEIVVPFVAFIDLSGLQNMLLCTVETENISKEQFHFPAHTDLLAFFKHSVE